MIKNSFLFCGNSQVLYDSKHEYFRWPDLVSNPGDKNENFNIINDLWDVMESKNNDLILILIMINKNKFHFKFYK